MLSTILDVNHNQISPMVGPWWPFLLCLMMTAIQDSQQHVEDEDKMIQDDVVGSVAKYLLNIYSKE